MSETAMQPQELSGAAPPARKRTNWLAVLSTPATLALAGILYPFAIAVYYSFTNYRITSSTYKFVGFRNYVRLFSDPDFWEAMQVTLGFAGSALVIELTLGFLIALLLSRQVKGVGLMRALLLVPLMLPPVISGMMWKTMLASHSGPIRLYLRLGRFPRLSPRGFRSSFHRSLVIDTLCGSDSF